MGCKPVAEKQIHKIQVKFTAELHDKIQAEAARMGIPMATWIKMVISKHLEEK